MTRIEHRTGYILTGTVRRVRSFSNPGDDRMKKLFLLLPLLVLLGGSARAQLFNGRLVTSAYGWERQAMNGEATQQARVFQNLQFNVGSSDISFHTSMQGSTDFGNAMYNDPQLRLYNAYVLIKNVADMVDLNIGRQPLLAGVSYGTIDGARVNVRPTDGIEVMGYAGGLADGGPAWANAETPRFFHNVDMNWQLGGQALFYLVPHTRFSLSYMNRHRESMPFWRLTYDPTLDQDVSTLIDYGSRANQYVSASAGWHHDEWMLHGRYDYDLNFERTARAEVYASYQVMPRLGLSLNLAHREPVLAYNSYFSLFEAEANQEAVLGVDYTVMPYLTLLGRFSGVIYDDDNAFRASVGAMNKYASIMYTKDLGYAGDLDGLNLQLTYPFFHGMLVPHLGALYSSYVYTPGDEGISSERSSTWAGVLGTTFRPLRSLSFDLQGQYMTNKIYKSDMRVFARLNYWFSNPF